MAAPLPSCIGSYAILREIGRGGMGIVYEGEQPNPRRRVAIKVLHYAHGSDGRVERMFRREAHALGRLRHPSIAAVYEAGQASDGRLFFAMELIHGRPLTEFAAENSLSIRGRAELFQRVCQAIAYAHQRGVIHRDIKPSNILVDSAGQPKILDFGLAKILEPDESMPAITAPNEEGRIQGTLPYMSPEQVRGELGDVDMRSDIYSLGVVFYELLTGRLPYLIDRARLTDSARTICEASPERMAEREVRGDLETIVLKALEKEPDRRYSSAAALAEDIGRWLGDQPITARPPTVMYQIKKLVARHKAPSALIAVMLVLIIGFGAAMGVLYAHARNNLGRALSAEGMAQAEAQRARKEAEVARQIKDFLVGVFKVSDPEVARGRTVTARELLDSAAGRVERGLGDQPEVQATLMFTIGYVYENLGLYDDAATLLQKAIALQERFDPQSLAVAETASTLATALRARGDLDGAQAAYEKSLAIMKHRSGGADDIHVIILLQALADVQSARGQLDSAEATLRELLARHRRAAHGRSGLPSCLNTLSGILADKGAYREAVPLMREAIEVAEQDGAGERFSLMSLRGNLAWLLAMDGQNDEAERLIGVELRQRRKVLPPNHPAIATSLVTMGVIHLNRTAPHLAEPLLREALQIRETALGPDNPETVESRGFLGDCLSRLGRAGEAEPLLLSSYESMRKDSSSRPLSRKQAAERLAQLYETKGESGNVALWRRAAEEIAQTPQTPH